MYDKDSEVKTGTGFARLSALYQCRCKVYKINIYEQGYSKLNMDAPAGAVANGAYTSKPVAAVVNQ